MRNSLLVAACLAIVTSPVSAAKPEVPPMPVAPQLPVEIVLAQQELGVEVPATGAAVGAGVGGLLGAMIGTAIDKAAVSNGEERVVGIRNLLVDYPFNANMEAALRAKLPSDGLSPQPEVSVCAAPAASGSAMIAVGCHLTASPGVLVITPRYVVDNKFENMVVRLDAQLVSREIKSNGKPKMRSRLASTYHFNFPIEKFDGETPEQTAARWTALGREPLSALLDTGIAQVTDMLAYDFSAEGRAERATPKRGSTTFKGQFFNGQQVRVGDAWVWSRMGKHSGDALHGYYPVVPASIASLTTATAPVAALAEVAPEAVAPAAAAPAIDTSVPAPATPEATTPAADAVGAAQEETR